MLKKIKIILASTFVMAGMMLPVGVAHADESFTNPVQATSAVCAGVNSVSGERGDCKSQSGVNKLVKMVINLMSWLVGVVCVIMIIISGYKYMTSGGDTAKVKSAKTTLLYALLGLAIVGLAQLLVNFTLSKSTKITGSVQSNFAESIRQ